MIVAAGLAKSVTAGGQCGTKASTCVDCHETRAMRPVLNDPSPWHADHAFGNFCQPCHGGDSTRPDEASAHAGLVDPLSDLSTHCASCHAADFASRGEAYRRYALQHPTSVPASHARAQGVSHPARRVNGGNLVLTALVLAVALGGSVWIVRNERSRISRDVG